MIPFDYQPSTGSGQRSFEAFAFGDAWQSEATAPSALRWNVGNGFFLPIKLRWMIEMINLGKRT